MKGKVIFFNVKRGFGFIGVEGIKDVYFHYSQIVPNGKKAFLQEGSLVEFETEETPRGLQAINIREAISNDL
jgi:CspA family cold shock protein